MDSGRRKGCIAIGLATLFWGFNFPIAKFATQQLDPFFIVAIRIFISTGVFYLLLSRDGRVKIWKGGLLRSLIPLGITGIILNQVCFISGIQRTTPGHSAVLMAMIPIIVAVLAGIYLRERMPRLGWVGILLSGSGAVGVVLSRTSIDQDPTLIGDLIILGATVAFSIYTVLGTKLVRTHGAGVITAGAYLCALPAVPILLWLGLQNQDWSVVTGGGVAALAYIVLFNSIFCYILYFTALRHLRAAQVAVFADVQPVLGTALSVWFGWEVLSPLFIGSGALAMVGVVLVQFLRFKK